MQPARSLPIQPSLFELSQPRPIALRASPANRRGRPPTGTLPGVAIRLHPNLIERIDAFAEEHGLDRTGAIRRLVERGLTA
jgi:hypothetical protein